MSGIREMTITCDSCPWQAEGRLSDGRWFYMRHRFCRVSLGVGRSLARAVEDSLLSPAITYHDQDAGICTMNGFCSGLGDSEVSPLFWRLWDLRPVPAFRELAA